MDLKEELNKMHIKIKEYENDKKFLEKCFEYGRLKRDEEYLTELYLMELRAKQQRKERAEMEAK